jgi:regulator of PEP synthase PpsR (kinase-PPPase family)
MKRYVFMISDGTGLTVEGLANSLITQFENIKFIKQTIPYIDDLEKAQFAINKINEAYEISGEKPLVFMTFVNCEIKKKIKQSNAYIIDLYSRFLSELEQELGVKPTSTVGKTYAVINPETYSNRIEAIDYALLHDDGIRPKDYDKADIILIGVSRSGKTPSCLYMALQFGILAANYPFTEEDLHDMRLPAVLKPHKHKLFGLTIDCDRLQQIRNERKPDSRYASVKQCKLELAEVEALYKMENIPYLDSTKYSIEEIATKVLSISGLKRKI